MLYKHLLVLRAHKWKQATDKHDSGNVVSEYITSGYSNQQLVRREKRPTNILHVV